ncbi:MAG: NAD-dependent epimerase/dehydratase family protein [Gaiellaceae bacterium]
MRALVTGAAGFIGSHLAEALAARGDELVAVDSFNDYYDPARKRENAAGFEVTEIDLAEAPLEPLLEGVDIVFHLAGQPGVRSFGSVFPSYLVRNPLVTQRVFEAAVAARVRVVYASSSSIYGDAETYPTPEDAEPRPRSPYGITKLACEHLAAASARSFGLDATGLRYFTVYGPRQRPDMAFARIVEALASEEPFELYGDGRQSRSFTYVGDVVEATLLAADAPAGLIYNVGGGEEATLREAIAVLERISGRRLDLRHGPPASGDMRRTRADTSRIGEALGWQPRTSLEQGLEAHWRWACARVAAP